MRISHKHKFIFLSRPKCASTSISQVLNKYTDIFGENQLPWHHHTPASLLKQNFENMGWDWNSYFKFISIRNPWDLVVSLYFYGKPDMNGRYFWETTVYDPNSRLSFKDWLLNSRSWDFKQKKFLPDLSAYTYSYYVQDSEKNSLVDFVVRVENLEEDLDIVSSKLGFSLTCLKVNATHHRHYQEYYDSESIEIVKKVFSSDIHYGKYSFYGSHNP